MTGQYHCFLAETNTHRTKKKNTAEIFLSGIHFHALFQYFVGRRNWWIASGTLAISLLTRARMRRIGTRGVPPRGWNRKKKSEKKNRNRMARAAARFTRCDHFELTESTRVDLKVIGKFGCHDNDTHTPPPPWWVRGETNISPSFVRARSLLHPLRVYVRVQKRRRRNRNSPRRVQRILYI